MKSFVVFCALFGLALASPSTSRALSDDLAEIGALIPTEQIITIVQNYANTDADVQRMILYLQGPEWHALVEEVAANPDYQALKQELMAAGLDIDGFINYLHSILQGIIVPTAPVSHRTVSQMLEEIGAAVPVDTIVALINDKIATSPEFAAFWSKLTSVETYNLVEQIRALPEVQRIYAVLTEMGVDHVALHNALYEFLGWPIARH